MEREGRDPLPMEGAREAGEVLFPEGAAAMVAELTLEPVADEDHVWILPQHRPQYASK